MGWLQTPDWLPSTWKPVSVIHFVALLCLWTTVMFPGVQADSCRHAGSDGVIDISSLGNADNTPRFKDMADDNSGGIWVYSYNPCYPFSEGDCSGAAACQASPDGSQYFQCGDQSTASWGTDADSGKMAITYTNHGTDIDRKTLVILICDQSATDPKLHVIGDVSNGEYHFELTSKCACPNGCGGGGPHVTVEVSISIGWILVIIFLVVLVVYCVGGVAFNRIRLEKTGVEMVPNTSFWRALPGLVKDGCVFVISLFPCYRQRSYEKI
ncbi:hypothetical protein BaRGS_00010025 [Batillaria attramentaria]|uniref:Autophagy-related protein 27 n=1 Tax=Batillaria attramentaria TaxID=370345 RepID=A0ABD0LHR7_9CAEN